MKMGQARIAVQGPLGFASGLPLYLSGATLTAWLANQGVGMEAIGAFALVALPYNLKFLWAPLLDRFRVPLLSRRRGWILCFQGLLVLAIAWLATTDARIAPETVALAALLVATLSASQDVVVDAYRTDVLDVAERGRGTSAYVIGYRLALILAGAGALVLSDTIGWRATYLAIAGLLGLGMVVTVIAPAEPVVRAPASVRAAVLEPFKEILSRRGVGWLLAFVALYRVGDALAGHFVTPFLLDVHFTNTEVGLVQKGVGMAATIVGVAAGGVAADRLGLVRAVLVFGCAQALANLGYLLLALGQPGLGGLVVAVAVDNVCNGLGTAAFVAYLMAQCEPRFSATQYALLTSLSTIVGRLLAPVAGVFQVHWGWAALFAATIGVAIPALVIFAARGALISRR